MNGSKMMREMRGKKTRWEREEPLKSENTDQVSEPKSPHFH